MVTTFLEALETTEKGAKRFKIRVISAGVSKNAAHHLQSRKVRKIRVFSQGAPPHCTPPNPVHGPYNKSGTRSSAEVCG